MRGKRGPRIGAGCPYGVTDDSEEQDIRVLLDHIHGFYETALHLLPLDTLPSLAPRLLEAGMCLGFLDPVSNIIANTIAYSPPSPRPRPDEEDDDDDANSILSKVIADPCNNLNHDMFIPPEEIVCMNIARRSLRGLISFLTFHFRFLAYTEAIRYLRLAGADLLAAVRLIKQDRDSDSIPVFNFTSPFSKMALYCAAVSAAHPKSSVLVRASLSLASRMVKVTHLLSGDNCLTNASIKRLTGWLSKDPKIVRRKLMRLALDLASSRQQITDRQERKRKRDEPMPGDTGPVQKTSHRNPPMHSAFGYTQSLKLLLLGKIHALYLEALALMPGDALRKTQHTNLIKGGYCYGPMDPVSNIILNTVWYGAMFPTTKDFELGFDVSMICTRHLARVECCSLYGLVAFLRKRFVTLTENHAMWYLLMNNADLREAMEKVQEGGHVMSGSYFDGLKEAAVQSCHPDCDALLEFIGLHSADMPYKQASTLTYCRLEHLVSTMLSKSSPAKSAECVEQSTNAALSSEILNENQRMFIVAAKEKFKADQGFFVKKVNAALQEFSQEKGVDYELHIICGVNPEVTKRSSLSLFKRNFKYEYFHINFLATAKVSNEAGTTPELFFAECSNSDKDMEKRASLCFPVKDSSVDDARCFCCEMNGIKIVHPNLELYHGLHDFKKIASGEHGVVNEHIISSYDLHADEMCTIKEDWIFFDPNMDEVIALKNHSKDWPRKIREWGRIC
ncbi:hypothetical protein QYE76_004834 [Lolium multiflorum]|uniref:Uncharacterized protein n=1 Tax=Lolium multiflorum TaxID=4521 RepID=A0AAD8RSV0_LOLMU|nr:hypothetical protein QYE76_004834 [Lolium multiflorum]